MSLAKQIEQLREEFPQQSQNPSEFERLSDLYQELKEKGLVKTPIYDLPHPDTIGRNLVWNLKEGKKSEKE